MENILGGPDLIRQTFKKGPDFSWQQSAGAWRLESDRWEGLLVEGEGTGEGEVCTSTRKRTDSPE